MATEQQLLHLYGGLLGVAPGAVGVDFRGRSASKIGSNTSIAAVMQTRSRTVEMPSGLSLPLAFGMNTRLIGSGRYVSRLSASASSTSHRSTPYARCQRSPGRPRPVRPLPPQGQALVGTALGVSMSQNIRAADLVVQGVEAITGFCLRFRV